MLQHVKNYLNPVPEKLTNKPRLPGNKPAFKRKEKVKIKCQCCDNMATSRLDNCLTPASCSCTEKSDIDGYDCWESELRQLQDLLYLGRIRKRAKTVPPFCTCDHSKRQEGWESSSSPSSAQKSPRLCVQSPVLSPMQCTHVGTELNRQQNAKSSHQSHSCSDINRNFVTCHCIHTPISMSFSIPIMPPLRPPFHENRPKYLAERHGIKKANSVSQLTSHCDTMHNIRRSSSDLYACHHPGHDQHAGYSGCQV